MPTEEVRREDADGVITITFTRDKKLNAVTPGMLAAVREAAADLADDDAQRVLVITGEGRYFTSGLDIRSMRADLGTGTDGAVRGSTMRRQYRGDAMHDFYDELESIEKPIVLAAQATCLGIGIELGASCDFRIAAEGAHFGLPEVANLSVLPGSGGISRLTRLIGPHWTKWIAMAGQTVDAEQALHIGLVHAVHPKETFAERVQEFARHLASTPREAMGLAKLAVDTAVTADRRTARDFDRLAQTLLFQSPEFAAQQAAFAAKGKSR
jgi:enoyl-CoA hydratase